MDRTHLILEERKLVQEIINQQEEMSFKIRGWAIALFVGMTFAYFRQGAERFSALEYFFVVLLVSILFYLVERRHMEVFFKLTCRVSDIENAINEPDKKFKFNVQEIIKGSLKDGVGKARFREILTVYLLLPISALIVSDAYQDILRIVCELK